jgi:multimeric flavodoxin WrbA
MRESVPIINGSTRPGGNTDVLLERVVAGASDINLAPSVIELRSRQISNCIGCYQCLRISTCSFRDDMTEIRTLIDDADLLVLASPLYWCGVTGLMKIFIDRLFFYYHPDTKPLISGKKAVILTPMNQKNIEFESQLLVEFYKRLFKCLGVEIADMVFFSDIMGKGIVWERPEYLEQTYEIGTRLEKYRRDNKVQQPVAHNIGLADHGIGGHK